MIKNEIIKSIISDKIYLNYCKKIAGNNAKDLFQDLLIILLEKSEEELNKLNPITPYIIKIIQNMVYSKTNNYHYSYRRKIDIDNYRNYIENESKYNYEIDNICQKTNSIIDSLYWYDKEIFNLYLNSGNKTEISIKTKINRKSIERTINKVQNEIKIKLKMPIKILLIVQKNITALQYHRQLIPHERLLITNKKEYEIHQKLSIESGEAIIDDLTDEQLKEYSIVYFLRQISFNKERIAITIIRLKSLNIKIILDIDDYWELPKNHYWHKTYTENKIAENTIDAISKIDHIITTTNYFSEIIKTINKNVSIIPNCISPDDKQWEKRDIKITERIRFGWIGGVFHKNDLELLEPSIQRIYHDKELKDKWQLCLGGFNPNTEYKSIEYILTNKYDFKIYDSIYYNYLQQYTPIMEHISYDKCYRRLWGKDIYNYGKLYNEIDVALIPLIDNKFNACKSELKIVEAGWMNKAIIVSEVSPYKHFIKHGKNGLVVNPSRNNIDWFVMMRKLILNPSMIEDLGNELNITIKKYFDIDEHNKKRSELYKSLII